MSSLHIQERTCGATLAAYEHVDAGYIRGEPQELLQHHAAHIPGRSCRHASLCDALRCDDPEQLHTHALIWLQPAMAWEQCYQLMACS